MYCNKMTLFITSFMFINVTIIYVAPIVACIKTTCHCHIQSKKLLETCITAPPACNTGTPFLWLTESSDYTDIHITDTDRDTNIYQALKLEIKLRGTYGKDHLTQLKRGVVEKFFWVDFYFSYFFLSFTNLVLFYSMLQIEWVFMH